MCYVCNEVAIDRVAFLSRALFFALRMRIAHGYFNDTRAARIDIVKTNMFFFGFNGFGFFYPVSNPAKPRHILISEIRLIASIESVAVRRGATDTRRFDPWFSFCYGFLGIAIKLYKL